MDNGDSHLHHYVPRWYQRRFLPAGSNTLCYLDLKPEMAINGNFKYKKKSLKHWAPARCFCATDLYSLRFGTETTDVLERRLFGVVDKRGAAAVRFFASLDGFKDGTHEAHRDIVPYLGAQRFRTPLGLDLLAHQLGLHDKNHALVAMQTLFQQYGTMWMEGVWEIVRSHRSGVNFIISDSPVTFFNRRVVPNGRPSPGINDFPRVGTRTIFPLCSEACLIITHLQLVRNPWNNPRENRLNARSFQPTLAKLTDIQFGRELEENEVLRINLILKRCARKYIASADEGSLYPERRLSEMHWANLDNDWFLLPNLWKVGFTTKIIVGYKDGSAWGMDEYGHGPWQPGYQDKERRDFEHRRTHEAKQEWAKRRFGKPLARVADEMRADTVSDLMMTRCLEEQGLLPMRAIGEK